jgi:hypothetical protein
LRKWARREKRERIVRMVKKNRRREGAHRRRELAELEVAIEVAKRRKEDGDVSRDIRREKR